MTMITPGTKIADTKMQSGQICADIGLARLEIV